ncbi:hypothetical protein [Sphingomonas yabuuchiae]|uniref:hypothetical protein n=1 Tax=Sphingomonas yabuuchiae TaxID=172044 RepID=UPI003D96F58D
MVDHAQAAQQVERGKGVLHHRDGLACGGDGTAIGADPALIAKLAAQLPVAGIGLLQPGCIGDLQRAEAGRHCSSTDTPEHGPVCFRMATNATIVTTNCIFFADDDA